MENSNKPSSSSKQDVAKSPEKNGLANKSAKKMSPMMKAAKTPVKKSKKITTLGSLKKKGKADVIKKSLATNTKKAAKDAKPAYQYLGSEDDFTLDNWMANIQGGFISSIIISIIHICAGDFEVSRMEASMSTIYGAPTCNLKEVILFAATVVFNCYLDRGLRLNLDALSVVMLPFYPPQLLNKSQISPSTKLGTRQLRSYQELIRDGLGHEGFGPRSKGSFGPHHEDMDFYTRRLPGEYTAQVALMAHLITAASRICSKPVPGLGTAPGAISAPTPLLTYHACQDLELLADMMARGHNWMWPQNQILRDLYTIFKNILFSYATARDGEAGTFGLGHQ